MILVLKKWHCFPFPFLEKNNLEIIFLLERKQSFLGYKNMPFIFSYYPKRLTYEFGKKMKFFLVFCFWAKIILK